MKIIAVSACPSGLMHTYMAAESLQQAALKRGIDIKIETHGAIGVENVLTKQDIDESDYVILMVDITFDESRFQGKPMITVSTAYAVRHADELLSQIGA